MGRDSKIEWCHHTFNPWIGCAKVSEGCAHCYAEREFGRKPNWANCWGPGAERKQTSAAYWKQPFVWDARAQEKGVRCRVFCGSLCDVFEDREDLDCMRGGLISLIEYTPHLDWLFLTKRPESISPVMDRLFAIPGLGYTGLDGIGLLPNLWVGVSVENQVQADKRFGPMMTLFESGFRNLFVSYEPALERVDWQPWMKIIRWFICGGESGPNARPMHPELPRNLRDQCVAAAVPYLFKQWGEWIHDSQKHEAMMDSLPLGYCITEHPWISRIHTWPNKSCSFFIGKKRAGRVLDGRVWDEVPRGRGVRE